MKRLLMTLCLLFLLQAAHAKQSHAAEPEEAVAQTPEVREFIAEMVQQHQFRPEELTRLFNEVRIKQSILNAMARPAEGKPWRDYRPLFIEPRRIAGGLHFWATHEAVLQRAEAQYGVPASLIVAIIGIETFYGRNTGSFRVMDALSTLAFAYPRRAPFFRKELEQYLLLSREAEFDPLSIKGSYAGAMGISQFMPSSYRQYGVDFDGDGHRDLWRNPADAIGSVGSYLQGYGWERDAPVVEKVLSVHEPGKNFAGRGWTYRIPVKHWAGVGVNTNNSTSDAEAMLFELAGESGPEYWLGLKNFYVITRYNRSFHYAMAAWELSQALEQGKASERAAAR